MAGTPKSSACQMPPLALSFRGAMPYRVVLARDAQADLDALPAGVVSRLLREVNAQLSFQPALETRNRKPLRPGGPAAWELRVQPYRVYYDVNEDEQQVNVVGVARKDRETARGVR